MLSALLHPLTCRSLTLLCSCDGPESLDSRDLCPHLRAKFGRLNSCVCAFVSYLSVLEHQLFATLEVLHFHNERLSLLDSPFVFTSSLSRKATLILILPAMLMTSTISFASQATSILDGVPLRTGLSNLASSDTSDVDEKSLDRKTQMIIAVVALVCLGLAVLAFIVSFLAMQAMSSDLSLGPCDIRLAKRQQARALHSTSLLLL